MCYCALQKDLFLHRRHREVYLDVKGAFKKKRERKKGGDALYVFAQLISITGSH